MKKDVTKVEFGRVFVLRSRCPKCKQQALIIDGKMACCGTPANNPGEYKKKREAATERRRVNLTQLRKKDIILEQDNKCFYCGLPFGSEVWTPKNGNILLAPMFDHVICWAYSGNSRPENMVASCRLCNNLKGSKLFENKEDAIEYIKKRREDKGYEPRPNDPLS